MTWGKMSYHSKYTRITLRCFDIDWDDAMQVARDTQQSLLDVLEAALTIGVSELQHRSEAYKARQQVVEGDPVRAMMAHLVTQIGPREAARALANHRHHPQE